MNQSFPQVDVSSVVVTFQALGTLLLALIIMQLGRIFVFRYARTWALAWASMSMGLMAVRIFTFTGGRWTWALFLIGEWLFLILLWMGCRAVVNGPMKLRGRPPVAIVVLVAIAVAIAYAMPRFNTMFIVEAAIVASGTGWSFVTLTGRTSTKGTRTLQASLLAMTIVYASYVPLFWMLDRGARLDFLAYSSLVDLLVDVYVGCAMILVTAESEKRELNAAIAALAHAQGQLEVRLQTDPLTQVMSRHAFHIVRDGGEVATGGGALQGVVAMIDVDDLKKINDEMGHAAGDIVIRAAANAVRTLIRADDLLFRWGGDEFVAIMPNVSREAITQRFAFLHRGLTAHSEKGYDIPFHVSWGEAEFGAERSLDEAIKLADERMYESRRT